MASFDGMLDAEQRTALEALVQGLDARYNAAVIAEACRQNVPLSCAEFWPLAGNINKQSTVRNRPV